MRQRWLLSSPLARAVLVILVLLTGFHLVLLHLGVTPDINVEAGTPLVTQRSHSGGVRDEVTLDFARQTVLLRQKLFSSALHPFDLRPFFHQATQLEEPPLVSVTTLVTPERRGMLVGLAERWGGHMSVTYRIHLGPNVAQDLRDLQQLLKSAPLLASNADIHVVIDDQPLQLNLWRNIARLYSPAKSVLMVDVDFVPDLGQRTFIHHNWGSLHASMVGTGQQSSKRVAFVVPAFEFAEGGGEDNIPETKQQAADLFRAGKLRMFHHTWFHGQGHTNYSRWLEAREEEDPYEVQSYHFKYEPFLLIPREAPFCDERFLGYGSNKCACVYELKAAGYSFRVLPQSFLVHRPHASEIQAREGTGAREKENQLNMEVMRRFMKDMELKYGLLAPRTD